MLEKENLNEAEKPQLNIDAVSTRLFVGCDVKLKSNEYSTGVIVGKSKRGKDYWKVEWDDGSGITNILGSSLNVC
jgi:hypothetical protein